ATGGTVAVNDTYTDGQKIVETLGNPGDAAITVTYAFEVSASACSSATRQQTTITLHPDPVFSITNATPSICEGTGVDITLNTPTEDGLIELLSVDYNGATDGTYSGGEQFGNGDKITETLTNPGDAPITVTYTFQVSGNGCTNPMTQQTTVVVNPDPVFSITNTTPAICEGTAAGITLTTPTTDGVIRVTAVDYG